ncbi:MAG: T9SS type A sorting domain-containing protein [Bacteroidetes bacterium]|nr:T9SS type A sorting domain-containing protein [Bacteroidota bacterium]
MKTKFILVFAIIILGLPFYFSAQTFSGGYQHSLAICSDHTVKAWGNNSSGELGIGNTTDSYFPVTVNSLTGIIAVSGGGGFSIALKNNGTLWAWGDNSTGELGNGNNASSNIPVQVTNWTTGYVSVDAGFDHLLAIKPDGTVWSWGTNTYGQLGIGNFSNSNVPVHVLGLTGIIAVSAGNGNSLALKNDGTVWAWGLNHSGQLGIGDTANRNLPVQINITNIISISAGYAHSLFLRNDSTVWGSGWNVYGQLGTGNNISSNTPVQSTGLSGIISITAGCGHSNALKSDGTIWAWGENMSGELGDGNGEFASNVPVAVAFLNGVSTIGIGGRQSFALKNDGTFWTWGQNNYGQLGNGNTNDSPVPVELNGFCQVAASVNEIEETKNIFLFPNPSSGIFTIRNNFSGNYQIEIFNSLGQEILHNENLNENNFEIDLGSEANGIYFVKVTSDEKIYSQKIIIEK